jgi:hypothetical protein
VLITECAGMVLAVTVAWGASMTVVSGSAASGGPVGAAGRATATVVGSPNSLAAKPDSLAAPDFPAAVARDVPAARRLSLNVDGLAQDASGPDDASGVSAVAGPKAVVEAAGNRLAVFTRQGAARCTVPLATLFGTAQDLSGPRLMYDATYDRYSLVATAQAAGSDTPAVLYLATSRGGDPCAAWWAYRLTMSGDQFPPGAWLDHPYLGQDPHALLLSSNTVVADRYAGSAAFAVPKAAVYAGVGTIVPTFPVRFSTAPVTASEPGDDSYFVAAVPGTGYALYRMVNSAGPGTALLDDSTVSAPFAAPARPIGQCGGQPLEPSDGRLTAAAVRVGDYLWFTHAVDVGGRPGVRYGAVDLYGHTATVATVAYSATSDDFNPSIGVSDAGQGLDYVWLNWAYTDTAARPCADVSAAVDGVPPGDGVPDRVGTGAVLVRGSAAGAGSRLSRYSSVAPDPAAGGCAAVTAQQYFATDGRWRTRIARVESC